MTKISELSAASALDGTEQIAVSQGGLVKRTTADGLEATLTNSLWTTVATSKYTVTPAETAKITCSDTSDFAAGLPLKYTYGGNTYYGVVYDVSASSYIRIKGPTLDTGADLTALAVGRPMGVVQKELLIHGDYADAAGYAASQPRYRWLGPPAYLVEFAVNHLTAGTWTPFMNIDVGGNPNPVSTANYGFGVHVARDLSWVENSFATIDAAKYRIVRDDEVMPRCIAGAGGAVDPTYFVASCTFVYE